MVTITYKTQVSILLTKSPKTKGTLNGSYQAPSSDPT